MLLICASNEHDEMNKRMLAKQVGDIEITPKVESRGSINVGRAVIV